MQQKRVTVAQVARFGAKNGPLDNLILVKKTLLHAHKVNMPERSSQGEKRMGSCQDTRRGLGKSGQKERYP